MNLNVKEHCFYLQIKRYFHTTRVADTTETNSSAHPFLSVAVVKIVLYSVVPLLAKSNQSTRQKAVHRHDHKVADETGEGLEHTCTVSSKQREFKSPLTSSRGPCWCNQRRVFIFLDFLRELISLRKIKIT